MQAEFTRYIKRWKVHKSLGNEILHKIIRRELWENFTMHLPKAREATRKLAFKNTRTFEVILDVLAYCRDSPGGAAVMKSVDRFLRNHKGMHERPGSERRKANNNDDHYEMSNPVVSFS